MIHNYLVPTHCMMFNLLFSFFNTNILFLSLLRLPDLQDNNADFHIQLWRLVSRLSVSGAPGDRGAPGRAGSRYPDGAAQGPGGHPRRRTHGLLLRLSQAAVWGEGGAALRTVQQATHRLTSVNQFVGEHSSCAATWACLYLPACALAGQNLQLLWHKLSQRWYRSTSQVRIQWAFIVTGRGEQSGPNAMFTLYQPKSASSSFMVPHSLVSSLVDNTAPVAMFISSSPESLSLKLIFLRFVIKLILFSHLTNLMVLPSTTRYQTLIYSGVSALAFSAVSAQYHKFYNHCTIFLRLQKSISVSAFHPPPPTADSVYPHALR